MFDCPHCSNELPDGAAFCNQCWRPVDDPPTVAARSALDDAHPGGSPSPSAEPAPATPDVPEWSATSPAPGDLPTFTPAPGGPAAPDGDDVTSAYPAMPPPQPATPWSTGADPTSGAGWGAPPAAPQWGQSQPSPVPPDPSAPPQGAYGGPPPGYGPPAGYGPPPGYGGPPGYPPPAYGYPQPYYGYAVPAGPGTNGMAIAALVTALVGLTVTCGFLSPLGVVFGHIALSQIKRTGESGRGMAIAGLVIGYLSLLAAVAVVVLLVASSGT